MKRWVLLVMRAMGLFAIFRLFTRRHIRILCWHGGCIGDERIFEPKLFVRKKLVQERLRWLAGCGFTPISLEAACAGLQGGDLAVRLPVVFTVDDGWLSSAEHVIRPVLDAKLPITLYLASQAMQQEHPVVDVTVEYLLWKAGGVRVELSGLLGLSDGVYDLSDREVRNQVSTSLQAGLKELAGDAKAVIAMLELIANSLGLASSDLDLSSGRFTFMCAEQVRGLGLEGCDIQLHGHEHRYPMGEPDVLRRDLSRCQSSISALGLPPARHYCYPSGEYDAHAPALLAGMGIASATTCIPGLIRPGDKPNVYLLPRFLDGEDVSMLDFEAEMSGVLELARKVRQSLRMQTLFNGTRGAVNA